MSNESFSDAVDFWLGQLNYPDARPAHKLILLALSMTNTKYGKQWMSTNEIAKTLGMTMPSARAYLAEMVSAEMIERKVMLVNDKAVTFFSELVSE